MRDIGRSGRRVGADSARTSRAREGPLWQAVVVSRRDGSEGAAAVATMASPDELATQEPRRSMPRSAWFGRFAAIGGLALFELLVGRYRFFTGLPDYDDEGYMILMFRQWIDGKALYDEVYTQYGPFHILAIGLPLRLLGVDHLSVSTGRLIMLSLQVGTTVLLALLVLKLTGSLWSALLVQFAAFYRLLDIVSLHPGILLMFALATLLVNVVIVRRRYPNTSDWVTGAIAAAVLLTKVNVGVFLLVALAYTVAAEGRTPVFRRFLLPASEAALVAVGPVLLLTGLRQVEQSDATAIVSRGETVDIVYWAITYVAAAITVVFFGRLWRSRAATDEFSIARMAGGFGGVVVALVALIVLFGSSIGAVVRTVLIRPVGQADALVLLDRMTAWSLVVLVAVPALLFLAWRLVRAPRTRGWILTSAGLRIVGAVLLFYGCLGGLRSRIVIGPPIGGAFSYVALAALVLLPLVGQTTSVNLAGRRLLAAFAVAHSLHAYPVAGVQRAFGLLFPLVCAAVVLHDGSQEALAGVENLRSRVRRPEWVLAAPTVVVLLALVWLWMPVLRSFRDAYAASVEVELPGADGVRVLEAERADVQRQVDVLRECEQFVTLPGENSLYLYTEKEPPTGFNTVLWPTLLNDEEQQAIVDVLESTEGDVCLKTGAPWTRSGTGIDLPGPLTTYLSSEVEFETVLTGPEYEIGVRSDR